MFTFSPPAVTISGVRVDVKRGLFVCGLFVCLFMGHLRRWLPGRPGATGRRIRGSSHERVSG